MWGVRDKTSSGWDIGDGWGVVHEAASLEGAHLAAVHLPANRG